MKNSILFTIGVFFLVGCNKTNPGSIEKTEIETPSEFVVNDKKETDVLSLNNGSKWKVNAEMKPFVKRASQLTEEFVKNHHTNYKMLATELNVQNDLLIKSCTMKGKGHEELHKWLHANLELVEELGKEDNQEEAAKLVIALQNSYKTYYQFFN